MDLPGLRCFIAVAEERHFRRAAVRLGMSQPPLSARIRVLETELGVRLFHRGPSAPVSLTPAGAELLPLAREIVADVEAAGSAMARVRRGQVGALAVAAGAGVSGELLADGIRRFRDDYPEVDVMLSEMAAQRQLDELAVGRLDVAVVNHVRDLAEASATILQETTLGIACAADDPLAEEETVDPGALGEDRLVLSPGTLTAACQQTLAEQCRELGFEPTDRHGVTQPGSFVAALTVTSDRLVAALTSEAAAAPLAWRPIDGPPLVVRTSALLDPSHGWAAARNFTAALAGGAVVTGAG
jgi:DNA-binding transcriptional LysR family regulator